MLDTSVDTPPINSLINEFAFVSAYIEPIHRIFEKRFSDVKSTEKVINRTNETKDCNSNNERIDLNHALKNQLVDEFISVIIAKGVISINTFNTI